MSNNTESAIIQTAVAAAASVAIAAVAAVVLNSGQST